MHTITGWRRALALTVMLGTVATATAARAAEGPVDIKGRLYVDGVERRVVCTGAGGNVLTTSQDQRTFLVQGPAETCLLLNLGLFRHFAGSESRPVDSGGTAGRRGVFVGIDATQDGIDTIAVPGFVEAKVTFGPDGPRREKGRIGLVSVSETGLRMVFVGVYRARF